MNEVPSPAASKPEIMIIPRVSRPTSQAAAADDDDDKSSEPSTAPAASNTPSPKPLAPSQLVFSAAGVGAAAAAADESEPRTRTIERREVDDLKRSNSILDRVSYFESSAQNSLVRPVKRDDSETRVIMKRVVAAALDSFEKSDVVLLGRQAPEAGDAHLLQQLAAAKTPAAGAASAESPPPPHSQTDDVTAEVTSDPIYAVPDRNRKSQKSQKSRPTSATSDASDKATPEVPNKSGNIE